MATFADGHSVSPDVVFKGEPEPCLLKVAVSQMVAENVRRRRAVV